MSAVAVPEDYFYPERRYARRLFTGRAVVFAGTETNISTTVQISEAGMLILTELNFKIGDALTIHFCIPCGYIRATAEVIYLLPNAGDNRNSKVGLRFRSISDSDRKRIREFAADSQK